MGIPYAEVIGDPIAHSKSPLIHKFWLERLGLEGDFRRERVPAEALPSYFARRREEADWRGCNVTIPHKQAALPFLDTVSGDAREAGAVNAVVRSDDRLVGMNTDVVALRKDLLPRASEAAASDLPLVLFGAGGAARAVLQVLRESQGSEVVIVNRNVRKAEALLAELAVRGRAIPLAAPIPRAWGIVNASSLGMTGYPPLPVTLTPEDGAPFVYDLVYAPVETDLLRQARALGCTTRDGLHMLIGQARAAFELFFATPAPLAGDAELRELLTR